MYYLAKLLAMPSRFRLMKSITKPQTAQLKLWNKEIYPLLKKSDYWNERYRGAPPSVITDYEITEYDDYKKSVSATLDGNCSALNGEEIVYWAKSSGTTGTSKYFPLTRTYMKEIARGSAPTSYWMLEHFPKMLSGKILTLSAFAGGMNPVSRIRQGFISNELSRLSYKYLKRFHAVSPDIFDVVDNEENTIRFLMQALASDVSLILSPTPLSALYLYEDIKKYRSVLLDKFRKMGTHPHVCAALESPDLNFDMLWPNLVFVLTWVGSICAISSPYLRALTKKPLIDAPYCATEIWGCVRTGGTDTLGGVLHPSVHVYEFIEEGREIRKENLQTLWQIEPGKKYEIFVTSGMGLVRYRMKDVVECTGKLKNAPIISFSHKADYIVKFDDFALTEQEIIEAFKRIGEKIGDGQFIFSPDPVLRNLVCWHATDLKLRDDFVSAFESALAEVNKNFAYVYHAKKSCMKLVGKPREWIKNQLLEHTMHAQSKPRLLQQLPLESLS